jgi:hypothetical protein
LVDLKSAQSEQFFKESSGLEAYFPLSINFVTQKTQAYCGAASIVMVLNALQVPAPLRQNTSPITHSRKTISSMPLPRRFCRAMHSPKSA